MTQDKQQLISAWSDWLAEYQPYCATTIHFLDSPPASQLTDAGRARHIDRIKAEVGRLSLKLDQTYFNTPHVGSRVAKSDRFDAICVIEKLGIHPHVHLAWFPNRESPREMHALEKRLRLCCILETFNRGTRQLENRDIALIRSIRKSSEGFQPSAVADWEARGWSVFSCSINGPLWIRYMLKEMLTVREFSDQVFFLSDLYSGTQRTKPTRYHSIDQHTGAHVLNLDVELVPKR